MDNALEKLLAASSESLATGTPCLCPALRARATGLADELEQFLDQRNGFYAFESALHVFPARPALHERDIDTWNDEALWISSYSGLANGYLFFAEDVFGCQFALKEGRVWTFDPETGNAKPFASNLLKWAELLLDNYEVLTGYPLAHAWQMQHGALTRGMRLVPKIPFVLGGEFSITNMHMLDAVKGMHSRACIALQIRDLPDGSQVRLRVVD